MSKQKTPLAESIFNMFEEFALDKDSTKLHRRINITVINLEREGRLIEAMGVKALKRIAKGQGARL